MVSQAEPGSVHDLTAARDHALPRSTGPRPLERALLTSLDFEESNMFPAIHEHLSVQEWSELNKQAIGNRASGPRARLILAGVVLKTRRHPKARGS
jgi:hypothetical protein